MPLMTRLTAEPPASASMPREDRAVDRPRMSASVMPAWWAAEASLPAMDTMSLSVVAKWLPRSTTVDARLDTVPCDAPVMFMNLASSVAAVSASMLVAMSRPEMTCANSSRFAVEMPSWPPSSSMLRMVSAGTGWTLESSMAPSLRASSSSSVASTVLRTPYHAESMSTAALTEAPAAAATGRVTAAVSLSPTPRTVAPTALMRSPMAETLSPASLSDWPHARMEASARPRSLAASLAATSCSRARLA